MNLGRWSKDEFETLKRLCADGFCMHEIKAALPNRSGKAVICKIAASNLDWAGRRRHCTPAKWEREVKQEAAARGVDPVKVMAGVGSQPYASVRWAVWRKLKSDSYSITSIGRASGFSHTTIFFACNAKREPRRGARTRSEAA